MVYILNSLREIGIYANKEVVHDFGITVFLCDMDPSALSFDVAHRFDLLSEREH